MERKGIIGIGGQALAAALSGEGILAVETPKMPAAKKTRKSAVPLKANGKPRAPYDPKINRWTGKPHEHKRERARHGK